MAKSQTLLTCCKLFPSETPQLAALDHSEALGEEEAEARWLLRFLS